MAPLCTTARPPFLLMKNVRKWLYQLLQIKYEPKTPLVEMACNLGIQNKMQAVCVMEL